MPQLTRKSPVWWKATSQTAWVWSVKVCAQLALWKSQSFTVESPELVTRWVPEGWKSTPLTQSLWPSPLMTASPLGTDQIFQVSSSDTVARTGLRGWKATAATLFRCALKAFFSWKDSTRGASNSRSAYGFTASSSGGSLLSPPFLVFLVLVEVLGASTLLSRRVFNFASTSSTLALIRSLSSLMSIFSFIATWYFACSSFSVGSYER
mmetsp:Transcript_16930/g.33884  ORF Transcript_16930/g.33884 Transcript_16930/m.33884 type:complete len:208 (+) Transcript_16930:542-1165(+)